MVYNAISGSFLFLLVGTLYNLRRIDISVSIFSPLFKNIVS